MENLNLNSKWIVSNVFSEFRFKTSPDFFDSKEKILKNLVLEYPNYDVQKLDLLTMHSSDFPGIELKITPSRFMFTFENCNDIKEFSKKCNEVWSIVNKYLNVKNFERIGVRATFIKNMSNVEANNKIIKLLNNDMINDDLVSAQLTLNFKEKEGKIRVAINGASIQTVNLFNANSQSNLSTGLLADIDFSNENVFQHHVNQHLAKSSDIFKKYLKLIDQEEC